MSLSTKKISEKDITFVVQGQIIHTQWTSRCVASIQKFFPASRTIISTHTPDHTSYRVGNLTAIADPGESKNNLRRQIATSRAGLELVTTPFACKIRSDVEFVHGDLLNAYNTHLPSVSSSTAFSQPVGILDVFTYHPHTLPLFLSDFITIGLTSDVQKIFNCPMPVQNMDIVAPETNPCIFEGTQIGPEQYLAWCAMGVSFHSAKGFYSNYEKEMSHRCLKNEYVILDITRQAGLIWHKNPHVEQMAERDCLHNEGWKNL